MKKNIINPIEKLKKLVFFQKFKLEDTTKITRKVAQKNIFWKSLKLGYKLFQKRGTTLEVKLLTMYYVLLNSAYTHKRLVFILTRDNFRKLLKSDKNLKKKRLGFSNSKVYKHNTNSCTYSSFLAFMHKNNIIKLHNPDRDERFEAAVVQLMDPDFVSFFDGIEINTQLQECLDFVGYKPNKNEKLNPLNIQKYSENQKNNEKTDKINTQTQVSVPHQECQECFGFGCQECLSLVPPKSPLDKKIEDEKMKQKIADFLKPLNTQKHSENQKNNEKTDETNIQKTDADIKILRYEDMKILRNEDISTSSSGEKEAEEALFLKKKEKKEEEKINSSSKEEKNEQQSNLLLKKEKSDSIPEEYKMFKNDNEIYELFTKRDKNEDDRLIEEKLEDEYLRKLNPEIPDYIQIDEQKINIFLDNLGIDFEEPNTKRRKLRELLFNNIKTFKKEMNLSQRMSNGLTIEKKITKFLDFMLFFGPVLRIEEIEEIINDEFKNKKTEFFINLCETYKRYTRLIYEQKLEEHRKFKKEQIEQFRAMGIEAPTDIRRPKKVKKLTVDNNNKIN